MSDVIKKLVAYLDENDVHYDSMGEEYKGVRIPQSLSKYHNIILKAYVIGDDESDSDFIKVIIYGLGQVEELTFDLLSKLNEFNNAYRWVKFYVDSDGDIILEADFLVQEKSNLHIMGTLYSALKIAEDCYPQLMKGRGV